MSLIDEALKRARQEAARQDAAAREARYAQVPVYVPPVRRSRPWLLPGVVAACLVAGGAAGMLISRSPHPPTPSPATPPALSGRGETPAEVDAKVVQPPAETKIIPKPLAEKPVLGEKRPESRPLSPGEGGRGGGRGGQGGRASAPAPLQEPAPPPPSLAPVGPVVELPQPPPPETRSYVREVPVDGGETLRLNGIAFSEKPVALFGDKVLAPGESVGGFTVLEIEVKRVKLRGPEGMVVYVSLK